MPPTLEDVGRKCGVSRSTVSRVINNSPLVNEETKKRVMETIKEMGYAPNFIARSLTRNCTETLAVTLPDITGGVYPEILSGMDEVASQRGYHVLVVFLGRARPKTEAVQELITHRRADAVISVAGTVEDSELKEFVDFKVPIISVARKTPVPGIPSVLFDNFGGASGATRLLINQGCKRIAHITGPDFNYDAQERRKGYRAALEEAGLKYDPALELEGDFLRDSGTKAMREALDRGLEFDGVFAGNDEMAVGARDVLLERGIKIPDDVAMVGFDDVDVAHFIGLSTVHVPMRKLGIAATQLAFDMIDHKEPVESTVMPVDVIPRASCMGQSS